MTLTAADVRVEFGATGLLAHRGDFNSFPKEGCQWAGHFRAQAHRLAGIGAGNRRDRARGA